MTDRITNREPEPEHRVFYRGYVLKATQNQETEIWTLSYNLEGNSPVISKRKFGTAKGAIDHGKGMIDFLLGKQDH
ncbi:hypothetical protein H6F88_00885 [Oculatella sp. FACHB-28]|uniref:hypothetical protein n=1 Tax=Oculatella sp. FACHB-28 TaxID=2692845 RepID=UPI001688F875|nr:hypothetical protein [Oculatella sp. FACHB-28]MBD2054598.1 hypothetical protein [Oculatella sp. FACHB-28]